MAAPATYALLVTVRDKNRPLMDVRTLTFNSKHEADIAFNSIDEVSAENLGSLRYDVIKLY
jgi:hypothetical protein